jgi:hypothetical protein
VTYSPRMTRIVRTQLDECSEQDLAVLRNELRDLDAALALVFGL